jgi:hypothetical protein
LQLREDFYATAWLHWLHIEVISGKPKLKFPKEKTEKDEKEALKSENDADDKQDGEERKKLLQQTIPRHQATTI